MCELFGMNAAQATDVNHSLALLRPRGGEIGPHADGWGVAFYESRAARIFKEPVPAAESRCLAFISEYDFKSTTVIAHIRKANPSRIGRASANTHPFEREFAGRSWVFAHNGELARQRGDTRPAPRRFNPIGETDSEKAFCLLLDAIAARGGSADLAPGRLVEAIEPVVRQLTKRGEFNFMLSNGEHLIAHAHTRLHALHRTCAEEGCPQDVFLLATTPLTDEPWSASPPGTLLVLTRGMEVVGHTMNLPAAA